MKNLILTLAAGFMILASCSKDDSIDTQFQDNFDTIYVLDHTEGSTTTESIDTNANLNTSSNSYAGALNAFTNGKYQPTSKDEMRISWKASQKTGVIFGEAELKQDSPLAVFEFKLSAECVIVEGNEAIFGGIITKAVGTYSDLPYVEEGWRVYFKVVDNGLGLGTNDKISNNIIFASPGSISLCNVYQPGDDIWSKKGYTDVLAPGYVSVSN